MPWIPPEPDDPPDDEVIEIVLFVPGVLDLRRGRIDFTEMPPE